MEIKDKLAVVTGGARRVGRAVVLALADAGARPVIHYHRSRGEALRLAQKTGGYAVQADLAAPGGAKELVAAVVALQVPLALWINSASTFEQRVFLDSDDELWARTLQLGLLSPVTCAREVASLMAGGGVMVNILDVAAQQPWSGYAHHCVAKAALQMLTRCLAVELAPAVRVCGVSPGLVLLPDDQGAGSSHHRLLRRIPLQRPGEPEDVARAVQFIVTNDYLTGTVIHVDGGLSLRTLPG